MHPPEVGVLLPDKVIFAPEHQPRDHPPAFPVVIPHADDRLLVRVLQVCQKPLDAFPFVGLFLDLRSDQLQKRIEEKFNMYNLKPYLHERGNFK